MSAPVQGHCPSCAAVTVTGDHFCESCGTELVTALPTDVAAPGPSTPGPASAATAGPAGAGTGQPGGVPGSCTSCGGPIAPDGYCQTCGARAPSPRDHFTEQPAPWVGLTCDRGIRHTRNEDAGAVAADAEPGSRAVLLVCDGVSSATDSDRASLAAVRAARDVLWVGRPQGMGTPQSRAGAIAGRLAAAADAALEAVVATSPPDHPNPASCTFVAAVVEDGLIVAGNVGDSRAYWFPDGGTPIALTEDDSMAAELIARGLPRQQAEASPQAHAITRWLGVDAPDHRPRTTTVIGDADGWLLVCSDGLWNYCSAASDLSELVARLATEQQHEPLATSTALVDWANAQGGQDNITVALARLSATSSTPSG